MAWISLTFRSDTNHRGQGQF